MMVTGLESDVEESKQVAFDLNLEPVDDGDCDSTDNETVISSDCPICLEKLVNQDDDRTVVKLLCGHQFHLDCIGSAFNAKNKMQCPLCRNVEQGQWLYAHGPPNQDFVEHDLDLSPELPLPGGLHDHEQLGDFLPYSAWSTNLSNPNHTGDNSFTRFNEWLPLPSLEEMVQNEIERDLAFTMATEHPLHNMRYGLEYRSSGRDGERRNRGEGSGSGGQSSNIRGSGRGSSGCVFGCEH